jgi:hypothetical protein
MKKIIAYTILSPFLIILFLIFSPFLLIWSIIQVLDWALEEIL